MFQQCKKINAQRLSKFFSNLLSQAKVSFPVEQHSNNSTGESDEEIPSYILLCQEFEEWKSATPTTNTQQQENCIVNAVVQHSLMEPSNPLGSTGAPLRSKVMIENSGVGDGGNSAASAILREGVSIIGMVEDGGVVSGAVDLVANGVTAVVEGISGVTY